jgi:hypothetical protein
VTLAVPPHRAGEQLGDRPSVAADSSLKQPVSSQGLCRVPNSSLPVPDSSHRESGRVRIAGHSRPTERGPACRSLSSNAGDSMTLKPKEPRSAATQSHPPSGVRHDGSVSDRHVFGSAAQGRLDSDADAASGSSFVRSSLSPLCSRLAGPGAWLDRRRRCPPSSRSRSVVRLFYPSSCRIRPCWCPIRHFCSPRGLCQHPSVVEDPSISFKQLWSLRDV